MSEKLKHVLQLIDSANTQDPNTEVNEQGESIAKELLYSQRMSKTLSTFQPSASDTLKIAARAQHIERWTSPRSDYPEGRAGYMKWRANLGLFHANRAAELAQEAGYTETELERIRYVVQKRGLKRDSESQALEDVICLVFLEYYLEDFALKHSEEKLIDIIQKTWAKMSTEAQASALKLPLKENLLELVTKALEEA